VEKTHLLTNEMACGVIEAEHQKVKFILTRISNLLHLEYDVNNLDHFQKSVKKAHEMVGVSCK
jgi:hypothetical protein